MRAFILAGLVLAALGGAAAAAPGDAVDVTDNDALIQFRPVVDCAANPARRIFPSIRPRPIAHLAAPVLTEKDFTRLQRLRLGGPMILRGQLTHDAQLKYYYATRDQRFRPMALIVQGRPTRVWEVRGPARPVWLVVSGGYLTEDHANEVADRYYAQGGRD